jgi:hypothetical protein
VFFPFKKNQSTSNLYIIIFLALFLLPLPLLLYTSKTAKENPLGFRTDLCLAPFGGF